jgi:hypothetical protein
MNGYLLQRTDGVWVSNPNLNPTGGSYTRSLQYAKIFPTREAAEGDRCIGNERVVPVEAAFLHRNI